jgi:parallel beta-helix repeat protein
MDCGEGIHILSTSYSTITNNTAENNSGGILFSDETGATRNNYVAYNTVENNKVDCGITLASHGTNTGVYNNVVAHNTSIGNGGAGVGIFAPIPGTGSYNNTILDNITKNNADGGVSLHSHSPETNVGGNKIIGNTISGNMVHPGSGAPTPAGIVLFADSSHGAPVIKNTTITGNTLSGETIDVYVGTAQTELALQANNLLGGSGTIGVENAGSSGTVNAMANYWGCAAGPNHPNCTTTQGSVNAALALLK